MLTLQDVTLSFKKEHQKRLFGNERQQVLKGVSFTLGEGECLGLIGESGSGKTTLGSVICGLRAPDSGDILMDGQPLYVGGKRNKAVNHFTSIVFQDYTSSVNPRFTVRDALLESLRVREEKCGAKEMEQALARLMQEVGLEEAYLARYPHELSGGQLQRVCIARAVAVRPKVIVLDEAVSSLDAATQTQVMDLLLRLQEQYGFSYLFITHDLTTITYVCNRVLFFQDGLVVQQLDDISQLSHTQHPYVQRLRDSVPDLDEALLAGESSAS